MGLTKKLILGVDITIDSKIDILEEIRKYFTQFPIFNFQFPNKRIKPLIIFTPNPEIINYAQKDDRFKQIVNTSQINIPDGMGVCWAISQLYGLKVKRMSGADLMLDLCKIAYEKRLTIGLIGGKSGVAVEALECLHKKYPNLKGWAMEGPLILTAGDASGGPPNGAQDIGSEHHLGGDARQDPQIIIDKITREKTDILFVALGFPKQEFFINEINQQLTINNYQSPIVMMAVGGSFDYLVGRVRRAPEWVRNIGLEWLYRLIHEPWRLPRQLEGGKFFLRVLTSK